MSLRESVARSIHERRGEGWDKNPRAQRPQPTWEETENLWGGDPGCSWADGVRRDADAAIAAILDALIADVGRLIEEQRVEMGVDPEDIGWTSPELLNRQAWLQSRKDCA